MPGQSQKAGWTVGVTVPTGPVRGLSRAHPWAGPCPSITAVLADMIATLDRFTDSEIPVPDDSSAAELRAFYAAWRSELAASAGFRRTRLIQRTAGQTLQAHFWYPTGRWAPRPVARTGLSG